MADGEEFLWQLLMVEQSRKAIGISDGPPMG
jgi:hypothetical protein